MASTARLRMKKLVSLSPCLLVSLSLLFLGGCGRSISKAQADRLKLGMTVAEVEDVLGKGTPVDGGEVEKLIRSTIPDEAEAAKVEIDTSDMRGVKWGDDKKSITVVYKNDKAYRIFTQGL